MKKVDPQLLKMALTPYPKLKTALFPQYTTSNVLPPDITLYHLIQVQYIGVSLRVQPGRLKPTLGLSNGRHLTYIITSIVIAEWGIQTCDGETTQKLTKEEASTSLQLQEWYKK